MRPFLYLCRHQLKINKKMKKLLPIIMILLVGLTACTDGGGKQYAGTYKGTFTFVKQDNRTKDGTVIITNNPLSDDGVLLYACLPLEYVSTGKYQTKSENAEYISKVLQNIIGDNSYVDTATETVKDITVEAVFSGNTVTLSVYYTVALLSDLLNTRVEIVTFTGTK
jgi:hypothetical protein